MGTLPDHQIRIIQAHTPLITPFDPAHVQPCSYDVHLDRFFHRQRGRKGDGSIILFGDDEVIDPKRGTDDFFERTMEEVLEEEAFHLAPGEFALGATYEEVKLPDNILARFEGKSSLGRLGLMTHITAGFIDPGFKGTITVELKNLSDYAILLYPGMAIGQLAFELLDFPVGTPYGSRATKSRYQYQPVGPVTSRISDGFAPIDVYDN